jgi:hypothetical protein
MKLPTRTAPTAKNQLMPRIDSHTPRPDARAQHLQVLTNGLRVDLHPGDRRGRGGYREAEAEADHREPVAISPRFPGRHDAGASSWPPGWRGRCPPRSARSAHHFVGWSCWGRIEYLTGPKMVECMPIRTARSAAAGPTWSRSRPAHRHDADLGRLIDAHQLRLVPCCRPAARPAPRTGNRAG